MLNKKIKWYFYLLAIFSGMLAIIPSTLIQYFIPNFIKLTSSVENHNSLVLLSILLNCLVLNGLIEEFSKSCCLMLNLPKKLEIKQFFILCIISGLSFGTFENIVYIISGISNPQIRLFTATLIHIVCAAMDGIFIYLCFQKRLKISLLLSSILIHTLYNFFAQLPGKMWLFSLVVILYGIFQLSLFYQTYIKETS
ncbi:MAG: PrsW family intramembrane metalloprotease [Treponemataceae bacterium]|nr:PrsW family intramembrane metalloprotease [Treponemataceae bacterium]